MRTAEHSWLSGRLTLLLLAFRPAHLTICPCRNCLDHEMLRGLGFIVVRHMLLCMTTAMHAVVQTALK